MGAMLVAVAVFSALGGFLYGYDLGLIGGALLNIQTEFHLENAKAAKAWIVGAAKLGAVLGTFLGGAAMHKYGRRTTIASNAAFFVAGPLIMAAANGVAALIAGRLVVGIGIGISAVVTPAYLGEMAPSRVRGAVVMTYEVMLCVGMLSAVLMDSVLENVGNNWRWMVGLPVIPGALLSLALCVLPESPRWLVMKGDLDAAVAALHRLTHSRKLTHAQASTPEVYDALLWLWDDVERGRIFYDAALAPAAAITSTCLVTTSGAPLPVPLPVQAVELAALPPTSPAQATRGAARDAPVDRQALDLSQGGSSAGADSARLLSAQQPLSSAPESGQASGLESGLESGLGGVTHRDSRCVHGMDESFARTLVHMLHGCWTVAFGEERRAVRLALVLAAFNQLTASTAIINYAPEVLKRVGAAVVTDAAAELQENRHAILLSALVALAKTVGVVSGLFLIDSAGRRPLLIYGSVACGLAMFLLAVGLAVGSLWLSVVAMCLYILAFSMSWAGVFWVLVSELFSMRIKSSAVSAATATLFLSGAIANLVFPSMVETLDEYTFVIFGTVSLFAAVYVYYSVPETKGKTLVEVQACLKR